MTEDPGYVRRHLSAALAREQQLLADIMRTTAMFATPATSATSAASQESNHTTSPEEEEEKDASTCLLTPSDSESDSQAAEATPPGFSSWACLEDESGDHSPHENKSRSQPTHPIESPSFIDCNIAVHESTTRGAHQQHMGTNDGGPRNGHLSFGFRPAVALRQGREEDLTAASDSESSAFSVPGLGYTHHRRQYIFHRRQNIFHRLAEHPDPVSLLGFIAAVNALLLLSAYHLRVELATNGAWMLLSRSVLHALWMLVPTMIATHTAQTLFPTCACLPRVVHALGLGLVSTIGLLVGAPQVYRMVQLWSLAARWLLGVLGGIVDAYGHLFLRQLASLVLDATVRVAWGAAVVVRVAVRDLALASMAWALWFAFSSLVVIAPVCLALMTASLLVKGYAMVSGADGASRPGAIVRRLDEACEWSRNLFVDAMTASLVPIRPIMWLVDLAIPTRRSSSMFRAPKGNARMRS